MFTCSELLSRSNEVLCESMPRRVGYSASPVAPGAAPFTTGAARTPIFARDVHVDPKHQSKAPVPGV